MQKHVILQQYFVCQPSALPKVTHTAMCCLVAPTSPFPPLPTAIPERSVEAKRSWGFVWLLLGLRGFFCCYYYYS